MMRSMFSAIAGLRNHQTFMDVVGNNIANVNTTGFKQSRVTFQDILSQTVRGASSPANGRGGINPAQVGLGMVIAGVDTVQTQGTLQSTSKLTDMAIQGDGFFVLGDGTNQFYSRDGAFDLSTDGTLVNPSSGLRVQGWQADATGLVDTAQPTGSLSIPIGQGMEGQLSREATITGNLNQDATVTDWAASNVSGGKLSVDGTSAVTPVPPIKIDITGVNAAGAVTGLSYQVWDSTAGAYGAATAVAANTFTEATTGLTFTLAASTGNAVGDSYYTSAQAVGVSVYDSLGTPHTVRSIFQKAPTSTDARAWTRNSYVEGQAAAQTGALTFDTAGKIASGGTGTVNVTAALLGITNGAADLSVAFDFSQMTALVGNPELAGTTDGAAAGTLSTFTVGESGEIVGQYSNGLKKTLGQIAIASFANPAGLVKAGGNLFSTSSSNAGVARVGAANEGGRGKIATGFLEMSNVDLAQQFTNMIMAERGFQANSRVITTSDEILQDLVNLKR